MNNGSKNKLIMVNSFKGGTGKTSVAMAQCVHNWKMSNEHSEDGFHNIYFIDIDRLGTSLSYSLFPDGKDKDVHYFEEFPRVSFDTVCNKVVLGSEGKCSLYAVLLNPVAKRRQDYDVHGRIQQHEILGNHIFMDNLITFIKKCMDQKENSLFVIDCSPGLPDLERSLLERFYNLPTSYKLLTEEIYVSTFDASQIRKMIDCLNDNVDCLHREHRKVSIVLNDLHNCKGISESGNGDVLIFDWKDTAKEILNKLKDNTGVKIRFKQYESGQLKSCVIKNERHISNNMDAYVLQHEYREGYISKERMDGE